MSIPIDLNIGNIGEIDSNSLQDNSFAIPADEDKNNDTDLNPVASANTAAIAVTAVTTATTATTAANTTTNTPIMDASSGRGRGRPKKNAINSWNAKKPKTKRDNTVKKSKAKDSNLKSTAAINGDEIIKEYFSVTQPNHLYSTKSKKISNPESRNFKINGFTNNYKKIISEINRTSNDSSFIPLKKFEFEKLNNLPDSPEVPEIEETLIHRIEFEQLLPLNNTFTFSINNEEEKKLIPRIPIHFPVDNTMRQGYAINTGGLPVLSKWYPKIINNKKYLFVAIIATDVPPSRLSNSNLTYLSMKNKSVFNSGLLIYEYDLSKKIIKLIKNVLMTDGSINEISFLSNSSLTTTLALITLSSNKVEILKITPEFLNSNNNFVTIKPSVEFKLVDEISNVHILTSTFLSNEKILIGTQEGFLIQFNIGNPAEPDFIVPLRLPSILSVKSSYPTNSNLIFISGGDFTNYTLDLNNPTILIPGHTSKNLITQSEYSFILNGYLYCDWPRTIKLVSSRENAHGYKLNTFDEGCINSIGTDNLNCNIIIGLTNGVIKLINFHHIFNGPIRKKFNILRLFKLFDNGIENYKLDLGFKFDADEVKTTTDLFKNDLNVMSVCLDDQNMVAACFANGLLLVEELQNVL